MSGFRAAGAQALPPRLLAALLAADRPAAETVIDDALEEHPDGIAILDDLLAPAMREIGRLWSAGEISVADEHLATAIAHAVLPRIYPSLTSGEPRTRGRVLLSGVDGEQHVFGLRMIADALEGAGYDVRNVAGSLPPDGLASAVRRHRPVLVGLADTMGSAQALRRAIDAVRSVDPSLPVLLGGAAADGAGGSERCEVCRNVRGALEAAERLLSRAVAT
ncbi:MAG TPA: B12-binding domain-containing protein [Solirubrobacteraceae bacterium]|nr:B12-binding domain-containing protein [Solirubrobacteraceae bacterium]